MGAEQKIDVSLPMTTDHFLEWSLDVRPYWELHHGYPVQMSAESVAHGEVERSIADACDAALPPDGPCVATMTTNGVMTAENDVRIPDVHIDCAPDRDIRRSTANEPVVIFEISVTSKSYDMGDKRKMYFENPHVAHYVVVIPMERRVYHWKRGVAEPAVFHEGGTLDLMPTPGISLSVADFWVRLDRFRERFS